MNGCLASNGCARQLTTTVRDHLVHVHVELRSAARHPDVKGKHVVMLARDDFVANLDDQSVTLVIQSLARVIYVRRALLERGVRRDHLSWNQILADAEVLQRALRLRTPQTIRSHL